MIKDPKNCDYCGKRFCNDCIKNLQNCTLCNSNKNFSKAPSAFIKELNKLKVTCNSCGFETRKIDFENHYKECQEKLCSGSNFGCKHRSKAKHMKEHESQCIYSTVNNLKIENTNLSKNINKRRIEKSRVINGKIKIIFQELNELRKHILPNTLKENQTNRNLKIAELTKVAETALNLLEDLPWEKKNNKRKTTDSDSPSVSTKKTKPTSGKSPEPPKKETPKKETPKKETPKKETPKKETTKKETPKKEITKEEKNETTQNDKVVKEESKEETKKEKKVKETPSKKVKTDSTITPKSKTKKKK